MMRSPGKGVCQPQCESVKVLSPEILLIALGQGFHFLEASIGRDVKGESLFDVPGSESVAGKRTVYIGTWENRFAPNGSRQEAEKATKRYGVSVVGLTHSRGVGRVMPVESRFTRHSKESALIRKDEVGHGPISELEETVEILQRLISEIATRYSYIRCAFKVSINEEPDEGNLQVRFCEGHASPYTDFSKTLNLLN
jgi:hypothetical protein